MKHNNQHGFTRGELMVVMAMVAILAGVLLPALANPRSKGDAVTCLANLRRLIQGWTLYSNDNQGRLVMNFNGGEAQGGTAATDNGGRNAPWAEGSLDWTISSDNTNLQFLVDDRYAKLARYLDRDPRLFRCPSDRLVSSRQRRVGWTNRSRSVSMSMGIGGGNAEAGPWNANLYRHVTLVSQFLYPGPSETMVFLEENPDSINDPGFFPPQKASSWTDQPGSYHDGGCVFAFADGHVVLHQWTASLSSPAAQEVHWVAAATATMSTPSDTDIRWVAYHTSRSSTHSF